MKTFGETLDKVMRDKGIKQVELSAKSGIYNSYISRLRSGDISDPTFANAAKLIRALDMNLDEFAELQLSDD